LLHLVGWLHHCTKKTHGHTDIKFQNTSVHFCLTLPDIRESTAFFEGSQALPACPSDNSSIKISTSMVGMVE